MKAYSVSSLVEQKKKSSRTTTVVALRNVAFLSDKRKKVCVKTLDSGVFKKKKLDQHKSNPVNMLGKDTVWIYHVSTSAFHLG